MAAMQRGIILLLLSLSAAGDGVDGLAEGFGEYVTTTEPPIATTESHTTTQSLDDSTTTEPLFQTTTTESLVTTEPPVQMPLAISVKSRI